MVGEWEISTMRKIVSLNEYKSLHWRKLKTKIDPLKADFMKQILASNIPTLKWFELTVSHNTNYDMDNVVGTVKPFVDMLVKCGIVSADNKKKWDKLTIIHDITLKKNQTVFTIEGEILHQKK